MAESYIIYLSKLDPYFMGNIDLFYLDLDFIPQNSETYAKYKKKHEQSDFKNNQQYNLWAKGITVMTLKFGKKGDWIGFQK